jgi:hypothetical protein
MQPLNTVQAASRRQVQVIFLKESMGDGGLRVDEYCYVDIIIGLANQDGNVVVPWKKCVGRKNTEILRVRYPVTPQARYHGRLAALAGGGMPVTRAVA